jgi:hypothetical protein
MLITVVIGFVKYIGKQNFYRRLKAAVEEACVSDVKEGTVTSLEKRLFII